MTISRWTWVCVAGLVIGTVLFVGPRVAQGALVSPAADLPGGSERVHPDSALDLGGNTFNVFTGGSMPGATWTLLASHAGDPIEGTMIVTVYSQVWQHTDGHLLFAYQLENKAACTASARKGNIKGYPHTCSIIDSGILDYAGDLAYDTGDILALYRPNSGGDQLAFQFEALDSQYQTNVEKLLEPGQTSTWFYVETDAVAYAYGTSTIMDSGESAHGMEVFVPIPEPATMVLVGLGLGVLLLRRRQG